MVRDGIDVLFHPDPLVANRGTRAEPTADRRDCRRPRALLRVLRSLRLARAREMVTDDFEMFHDKERFHDEVGQGFLDGIAGTCAAETGGLSRAAAGASTLRSTRSTNTAPWKWAYIASTSCCPASPRNWSSLISRTSGRRTRAAGSSARHQLRPSSDGLRPTD